MMNKQELLRHVGDVSQIGGIRDFTFNDGKRKGVRAIEVDTGVIRFTVLADRGLDIADAHFNGSAVAWISKTGIVAPTYYEKDGKGFLRGFFGGLVTTCGLKNIGGPVGEYGLHGRAANIPAENVCVFADWIGDEYVMRISGMMRDAVVFGENLVIKRTITAKLYSNELTLEDTVINEGFENENIALCYHCNFGYPLVREGAKILGVPDEVSYITAPIHKKCEECIGVDMEGELATVGIDNGECVARLTYKTDTMQDFLIWKMLGESEYVVGLEPRTTRLGGQGIIDNKKYVSLAPFEEYKTYLKFEFTKKEN
ncbi:MAG: DUF4432 family protein [Clostridia bacterium]|nr:DUF4432 family protein [Clostridia bacterium]